MGPQIQVAVAARGFSIPVGTVTEVVNAGSKTDKVEHWRKGEEYKDGRLIPGPEWYLLHCWWLVAGNWRLV